MGQADRVERKVTLKCRTGLLWGIFAVSEIKGYEIMVKTQQFCHVRFW